MLFINLGRFSRAMAASYFKVKRVIREHKIYYLERDVTNETKNKKIHKKQKNIMSERQRERTMKQRSVWVLGSKWV